ncbi:MAG: flagellin [Pikeienuella sp.]
MTITGLPDLLTAGRLSRGVSDVNRELARVAEELTSGLQTNLMEASGGDPSRLYAIERDLMLNQSHRTVIDLAQGRAAVSQTALGQVQAAADTVGASLAAAVGVGDIRSADLLGADAQNAFETAVAALNARFGDRTVFSGAAASSAALADADVILSEIATRASGASDAASLVAAVDDYFTDPQGFATTGYFGADLDAPEAEIYEGERLSYAVRADDEAIVATLAALALGTMAAQSDLGDDARLTVYREVSNRGIVASEEVVNLRAELGSAEERLEEADARNESARLFLLKAQSTLLARDPFEAATEFSALETQLQTMFSVTARLSSLSMTNFLR